MRVLTAGCVSGWQDLGEGEGEPLWTMSWTREAGRGAGAEAESEVGEGESGVERRRVWAWRKDCLRVGIVGMVLDGGKVSTVGISLLSWAVRILVVTYITMIVIHGALRGTVTRLYTSTLPVGKSSH